MHSAIEDKPLAGQLEAVAVGPDLGATREINEFQRAKKRVARQGIRAWPPRDALKHLFEDAHPISEEKLGDVLVAKSPFDQAASKISGL
jgi:hypothetical protein